MVEWSWLASSFILGAVATYVAIRNRYGLKIRACRSETDQLKTMEAQLRTEVDLLRQSLEELKSTEALLRMELNETGLANTRLETLLEEARKQTEQQQAQFELFSQKTLKALKEEMEEKGVETFGLKSGWVGRPCHY